MSLSRRRPSWRKPKIRKVLGYQCYAAVSMLTYTKCKFGSFQIKVHEELFRINVAWRAFLLGVTWFQLGVEPEWSVSILRKLSYMVTTVSNVKPSRFAIWRSSTPVFAKARGVSFSLKAISPMRLRLARSMRRLKSLGLTGPIWALLRRLMICCRLINLLKNSRL